MDYLTKLTYFISIKDNTNTDQLGKMYVREIMRLHGMLKIIVSDKDTRFVSTFR